MWRKFQKKRVFLYSSDVIEKSCIDLLDPQARIYVFVSSDDTVKKEIRHLNDDKKVSLRAPVLSPLIVTRNPKRAFVFFEVYSTRLLDS